MFNISVIICTHNPRNDYLERTLDALRHQTFKPREWELVLVDNASTPWVSDRCELKWHPHAQVVREERIGQVFARAKGVEQSTAPMIVFIDDDNVVNADYLDRACSLFHRWPQLGTFCGSINGEFEILPPWMARWQSLVAVSPIDEDRWSNNPDDHRVYPCGAGLVVRRDVASRWAELVLSTKARWNLSRSGAGLSGCDDTDIILTGFSMGYGTGRFRTLELTHLIPRRRVEPNYLVKIAAGHASSDLWLRYLWKRAYPRMDFPRRLISLTRAALRGWLALRIEIARQRAMATTMRQITRTDSADSGPAGVVSPLERTNPLHQSRSA